MNNIQKQLSLILEIKTSIKLIKLGFSELQKIDGVNDFYHLPLLLLANGFERFMKCVICIKYYIDNSSYPTTKEVQTHDLVNLKSKISDFIENSSSPAPALQDDYALIKDDEELRELLDMLSEFGKSARYYNLDVITGNKKMSLDVESLWSNYEMKVISKNPRLKKMLTTANKTDELFTIVNSKIIYVLEKFARALSRQFTLGCLQEEGKQYSGLIYDFLCIMDDKLGKNKY